MRSVLALSILLAAPASAGDIPDISILPYALRTMSPGQLGSLLFGANAPPFEQAWVEGPTRQDVSISVDLATTPRPTGYVGLCQFTLGNAYFGRLGQPWNEGQPVNAVATPRFDDAFLLTSDRPGLMRRLDDPSCVKLRPLSFSNAMVPTILHVSYSRDGKNIRADSAPAARYGVAALMAAQNAAEKIRIRIKNCASGFTDIPASCGDPKAFVKSFYLRQVWWLSVAPCPGVKTICVRAMVNALSGSGQNVVLISTGESTVDGDIEIPPVIKSIEVHAGGDPIVD